MKFTSTLRHRLGLATCAGVLGAALLVGPVAADQVQLTATLLGANEVPGPGDPNGTGTATVTVDTSSGQLCYQLTASGFTTHPIAAHIHHGGPGEAGPVVVPLTPPTDGNSSGCVTVDPALANGIATYADQAYYVNIHTAAFPDGAARGQLFVAGAAHDGGDHTGQGDHPDPHGQADHPDEHGQSDH